MAQHPLRVLIVDNSVDDAQLIAHALATGGYQSFCRRVDTPEALTTALRDRQAWDLITCDAVLPHLDIAGVLAIAHDAAPQVPVLLLSGRPVEALRGPLRRGEVSGFLSKDRLPDLPALVAGLIPRRTAHSDRYREVRDPGRHVSHS